MLIKVHDSYLINYIFWIYWWVSIYNSAGSIVDQFPAIIQLSVQNMSIRSVAKYFTTLANNVSGMLVNPIPSAAEFWQIWLWKLFVGKIRIQLLFSSSETSLVIQNFEIPLCMQFFNSAKCCHVPLERTSILTALQNDENLSRMYSSNPI